MMSPVTLAAHFDGQPIVLDGPNELEPNTPLIVVVQSAQDDEDRAGWLRLSMQNFAAGYEEDEPEYTFADIKKWNPLYKGRRL